MIIYLVLEIAVRELSSHLLFSVLAASRGHQVLIGPTNDIWLYKRLKLLPPGALMVKNMNVPLRSQNMYASFIKDGFDMYCHEAEPAILWSDFEVFLKAYCLTSDQYLPFKGVFCWGERDYTEYTKLFSDKKDIFHITGSPRIDLWSPNLRAFWQRDYLEALQPYILFVSNNSWVVGKRHWSEFLAIQRDLELTETDESERELYKTIQKDMIMVEHAVFSLRDLAREHKEINFIVRPHPWDNEDYWRVALGEHENIKVIYRDNLSPWIAGATAIIHNSCTSAVEAAVQGIPVISYVPSEITDMSDIANNCGVRVKNHQELNSAVISVLAESKEQKKSEGLPPLLSPLLSTDHELASLKIIREIEKSSEAFGSNKIDGYSLLAITMARQSKSIIDKVRRIDLSYQNYKFNKKEVKETIKRMSDLLGVPCPKVRFVSDSTILIG